jgi:hypothetical protein
MLPQCQRERELAAVVRAGRWADACEPELRAHVAGCAECQDVLVIAELMLEADRGADVRVPSAAQMWSRLAVRTRAERERAAARPVVWLQGIAAACGVGVALTALGHVGPVVAAAGAWSARVAGAVPNALPSLTWPGIDLATRGPGLVAAAGALLVLVLASTAAYLWVVDE